MKPSATIHTRLALFVAWSLLLVSSLSFSAQEGNDRQTQQPAPTPGASEPQPPPAAPNARPQPGAAAPAKPNPPPGSTPQASRRSAARRKHRARKAPKQESGKVVVANGGVRERATQLTPGMSQEQARRQLEKTTQLMARTDSNLKQVSGRQLTPAEQSMVEHVRNYLRQAKAAEQSGDVARAHTLAYKAQLLSSELARR